ncbi:MAG TPA: FtsQ-type POTRA domain-containing protein [Pyrinomonadaceae bacterium]|nr:FtsQ-type POTRA domain-containing protein [Pyrinomonadaceae bacterium]
MRDQVITPRAGSGRTTAAAGKGRGGRGGVAQQQQQRPTPRRSKSSAGRRAGGSWGAVLRYLPLAAKLLLAVCAGLLIFKGYTAMASASFFHIKSVEVEGEARVSEDEIKAAVHRAADAAGVWKADLAAVSDEIKKLKWVRTATVARVLPSGLRVRVTEREPRLVARNSAGGFDWVDEDGVLLGKASVADVTSFLVRGLDETTTEFARQQNRERVQKALEMEREWKASGLIERVSEVNLDNLKDVRAQLSGDYSQIQVFLGERDFGRRLARAFKALAEVPNPSPRGPVTYLDATREKGVTVGFSTVAQPSIETAAHTTSAATSSPSSAGAATRSERKDERKSEAKKEAAQKKKKDEPRRPATSARTTDAGGVKGRSATVAEQRPRRVNTSPRR